MPPKKSLRRTKSKPQKRGRKPLGSKYINVSVPKELLGELDAWMAKQPDRTVYPEAIRRLIILGLHPAEPQPHATQQKPRTARARWDDYRPTPHQLQAIDAYRNMVRPALTRAEAVSLLVDTALRRIGAPDRIHAEGELGDWAGAAPQPPQDAPEASEPANDSPEADHEPPDPSMPPAPRKRPEP